MRKPVLLIFTNACILILVFALLGQSLFITQRVAVMRRASGTVSVQRAGEGAFSVLSVGAPIQSGDVVRTGRGARAEFAYPDGTRWQIAPDSRLAIERAQINPAGRAETVRFRLEQGQILLRAVKPLTQRSQLEIAAPGVTAAIRNAIARVSVMPLGVQVQVLQGRVDVSDATSTASATKIQALLPGQLLRASALGFKTSAAPNLSEFLAQPDFLRPELHTQIRALDAQNALISGQTEAGNRVTIDGAQVPVLAGGSFFKRVVLKTKGSYNSAAADAGWKVQSTDRYGASTTIWQKMAAHCEPER